VDARQILLDEEQFQQYLKDNPYTDSQDRNLQIHISISADARGADVAGISCVTDAA
jgi:hypothetical protein